MPQEAQKLSVEVTADTTGLDDFFSCHDKAEQEDLTLEEATKRLNLSERTVQRRLKNGQLRGYKIAGPRGPEWRIEVESSEDTTSLAFAASDDTPIVETGSTEDTTCDSKATTANVFSQLAEFYHDQIETLQEKLEAATYRNGYLEAQLSSAESQLKLLPDLSAKATTTETLEQQIAKLESELALAQSSWWVRFGRWFLGKK